MSARYPRDDPRYGANPISSVNIAAAAGITMSTSSSRAKRTRGSAATPAFSDGWAVAMSG